LRGAWRAPGKRPPRFRVDGGLISGQRSARKSSGGTISVGEACTGRLLPEDVFRAQGSTSRGGQVGDLSRRGSHCCEWLRTGVSGLVRERLGRRWRGVCLSLLEERLDARSWQKGAGRRRTLRFCINEVDRATHKGKNPRIGMFDVPMLMHPVCAFSFVTLLLSGSLG